MIKNTSSLRFKQDTNLNFVLVDVNLSGLQDTKTNMKNTYLMPWETGFV